MALLASTRTGAHVESLAVRLQRVGAVTRKEELAVDEDILSRTFLGEHKVMPLGGPPQIIARIASGVVAGSIDVRRNPLGGAVAATHSVKVDILVAPRGMRMEVTVVAGSR